MFHLSEQGFRPTEVARGPWDAGALHGGAPAALIARAFERLPSLEGLALARITYELLRPVPVEDLMLHAEIVRPGKRVQLLEASLQTAAGVEVVRARGLRVRLANLDGAPATDVLSPPPGPATGVDRLPRTTPPHQPTFFPAAIETRFVAGGFGGGPAACWFRLKLPLIDGEAPSPLQQLAAAADFGNGISSTLDWADYTFINPDLTIYLDREPVGEWIGLDARTTIVPGGVGTAESVLFDERGRVGRAMQALLVARR